MATKKIMIGGQEVQMLAVSSCNYFYRRIFGEDPFEIQAEAASRESGAAMGITFAMQMGFIMKSMAESNGDRSVMNKISIDDYLDWIDLFDTYDFAEPSGAIIELYASQNRTHSAEKKEPAAQSGS
jgi:hypothetical protein